MIKDPYVGMPIKLGNRWNRTVPYGCECGEPRSCECSEPCEIKAQPSCNISDMAPNMQSNICGCFDEMPLKELPLAMCYVPMQQWRNIYPLDKALERATIFAELDLPFKGGMKL